MYMFFFFFVLTSPEKVKKKIDILVRFPCGVQVFGMQKKINTERETFTRPIKFATSLAHRGTLKKKKKVKSLEEYLNEREKKFTWGYW